VRSEPRRGVDADVAADPPPGHVLGTEFFDRDTVQVARELLGKVLVRRVPGSERWGRIVEVEAYLGPEDRAAHSFGGHRSPRNEVMFAGAGRAYVYLTYGMHHCLNFVTREDGMPQAVLARALEPGPGVGRCSGPGLICRSLEIDRTLNGALLVPPDLYVIDDGAAPQRVYETPRIGVSSSGEWVDRPLRFCWDSPHLSRPLSRAFRNQPPLAAVTERHRGGS
jgi:DNA-3-methyladenine glycosylase